MARRSDPRPLVVEVASILLDRVQTALCHASLVAANGRPVWMIFSGTGVLILTPQGLRGAQTATGQQQEATAERREALHLPDINAYFDAFRSLPVRIFVHPDDVRDLAIDEKDFRASLSVERIDRQTLIKEAQSDAWMVF